jgi:hypothetical protein
MATDEARISRDMVIAIHEDHVFPVNRRRWQRLRRRVGECRLRVNYWAALGTLAAGVLVTSAGELLDRELDGRPYGPWTSVAVGAAIATLLSGVAALSASHQRGESIESILEELDEIEAEYTTVPENALPASRS